MIRVSIYCVLILYVVAAPIDDDAAAKIVSFENTSDGKGNYRFSFDTSNGIFRDETGTVVNEGQPNQYIRVQGFISFTDPDGNIQTINYEADENGYKILPQVEQTVFSVSPNVVATLLG